VRYSLDKGIKKGEIERTVEMIVNVFLDKPFNELLLYSYTISKDNYLPAHITNNVILSVGFGVSLGLSKSDLMDIGTCAFCHDFGMAEYAHLFQRGVQLNNHEYKMIQQHPRKSADLFKDHFSQRVIDGVLDMHEQVNGNGYPKGKQAPEISFLAKVVSICDVFEALTDGRSYRKGFSPYEAMKIIIKKKDVIFEAKVVKKFVEFMSIYPVGNLVYLNTGEMAIVVGSNRGYPTRAIVRVLLNSKREILRPPLTVNLLDDNMLYISRPVDGKDEEEILQFLKPRGGLNL
jgi:HD-GYP domain-containing protein (c-di-GMP phosphodiesterase class II)